MADKILKSITFPDLADRYVIPTDAEDFTYEGENLKEVLDNKANVDGYYQNMSVGDADQLNSTIRENDKVPYVFRTSGGSVDIGDREYVNGIVGGTVAWNQLISLSLIRNTRTVAGVTFTNNGDGSVTIAGTPNDLSEMGVTSVMYFNDQGGQFPSALKSHKFLVGCDYFKVSNVMKYPSAPHVITGMDALEFSFVFTQQGVAVNETIYPQLFDLTQMFGSTIADYIYSLEQATAGAGVAWFKKLFPKPYYAYNAGELKSVKGLVSHDMTGFNQWDEEWATDLTINGIGGNIGSKNHIPVVRGASYYVYSGAYRPSANGVRFEYYDADKNSIGGAIRYSGPYTFPDDCCYIKFGIQQSIYGTTYKNDICINLSWDGSRDGEYEPYQKWSYPLDSDLELRGIPKIENGNLYFDGDIYEPDGTVTRKYGIVDLGSLTWTRSMSNRSICTLADIKAPSSTSVLGNYITSKGYKQIVGTGTLAENGEYAVIQQQNSVNIYFYYDGINLPTGYMVYELATPTEESADPYNGTQIVDDFGTEEFILSDSAFPIPVGHDTDYPVNLKAKLEMAPNSPSGDGDYIVRQTNGTNAYVPLIIEDALPTIPSTAGSYKLVVTVADGSDPVLSWESEV